MGKRQVTWRAEPHTIAKHRILRAYLDAWIPIMGSAATRRGGGRLVFVDGFAGPGSYEGGEPGSPVVALRSYLDHPHRDAMNVEYVCLFIDADARCIANLETVVLPSLGSLPTNVHTQCRVGSFDENMRGLLDGIVREGKHLAPTFAFVDPFGFSDTPMSLIARLLDQPRSEVMITFMVEPVNRFLEHPDSKIAARYDDLFGDAGWRDLTNQPKRINALSEFYGRQLLRHGAKFVCSFRMLDAGGRPIYDLWFATKHLEGLKKMKRAMWKVDPVSGTRFSDRIAQNETLFGPEPDTVGPANRLCAALAGRTVQILDVEEWVLTQTGLHDGHIRRGLLMPLEDSGKIKFVPGSSSPRHRGQYPQGCRVTFL
ncbi:MAG: three-Cys-motif partner protein TcmP [Actinomycetota bacterium]